MYEKALKCFALHFTCRVYVALRVKIGRFSPTRFTSEIYILNIISMQLKWISLHNENFSLKWLQSISMFFRYV